MINLDEERPELGERAVLVQVDFADVDKTELAARLHELRLLTESAGAEVMGEICAVRRAPDARFYIGKGKVDEVAAKLLETDANLLIVNHDLSPAQERNLERALKVRVIDRSSLILDIFAQRAVSAEGRLQVELAQLTHLSTRLVRGWTHLERQQGGIGLRGPGESQLETDRRLIGQRMRLLKARLQKLAKQRRVQRRSRSRRAAFNVSLIGYTNAGKSTLFNALTRSGVYAANQLFATLDTTSRRTWLPDAAREVVLSDTVGFIRDLPHTLVAAFHATLEATVQADLLLHVVDAASPVRAAEEAEVQRVLQSIGGDQVPQLLVYNKIDCSNAQPGVERDDCGTIRRVRLSAKTGVGLEDLRQALSEFAVHMAAAADGENLASSDFLATAMPVDGEPPLSVMDAANEAGAAGLSSDLPPEAGSVSPSLSFVSPDSSVLTTTASGASE